jgi:putative ABC transport system ATP-binding protein
MIKSIFGYIFYYSKSQQIKLLLFILLSFPFLYGSLDLPKTIINEAIGGKASSYDILGFEFGQLSYLWTLCGIFLSLVFINGGFKYFINVYRGVMAERMLRRLRYQLIERVLRFPLPHFRNISQGEIVSMVMAETEPLGGFIGESFSLPVFQGGILITILTFMFIQDPVMGIAAISLYPLQAYLIPKLQRRVNQLGKERVKHARKVSERLGEMVTSVADIHANDTAHFELADFSKRLGIIYEIRREIYRKKFFIKFLNNFLAQLTPFFFFSIGGYLVIKGDLTLGGLVAILAAYKDLSPPWKDLLSYYQRMEDAKIKFTQVVEQFEPEGLIEEHIFASDSGAHEPLSGKLMATNLTLEEEEGNKIISGASFSFDTSEHVALIGSASSGKSTLSQIIARLIWPTSGKIVVDEAKMESLPRSVVGRSLSYVDQEPHVRSGSILDNLLYGLKHYPVSEAPSDEQTDVIKREAQKESAASGNSPFDIDDNWTNYQIAGVENHEQLMELIYEVLKDVGLEEFVFNIGLNRVINPDDYPQLVEGVMKARKDIAERLKTDQFAECVETYDKGSFIKNASVSENILFGTSVNDDIDFNRLGEIPYVQETLEKCGLLNDFLTIGSSMSKLMIELFHDLPPGHDFFERFSFIDSEDFPEFQRINLHVEKNGYDGIESSDKEKLIDLAFKLVVAQHHLDLIDAPLRERILEARTYFTENLPESLQGSIEFFDVDHFNAASSIQNNILFGKIANNKAESTSRIGTLLTDTISDLGLGNIILEVGLDFDVGVSGKKLSSLQRQQISLARSLLKNPQLLIVNQATASFDEAMGATVRSNINKRMAGRGLLWVDSNLEAPENFDKIISIDLGKVAGQTDDGTAGPAVVDDKASPKPVDKGASSLHEEAILLADVPFFTGLDQSKLKLLAFTSERQDYAPGQVVFWQGRRGETAYVVISGILEVRVDTQQGLKTVATPGRGDVIGELALICDAARTATVQARDDVSVLTISKDVFLKLIMENADVSANLTRILANKLETTMRSFNTDNNLYDDVTGLPTQDLFIDRLKHVMSSEKRSGKASFFTILDLNELDFFNQKDGVRTKHKALLEVTKRLNECLRETDTIAHLDNDYSFGIIAVSSPDDVNAVTVKSRLLSALEKSFVIGSDEIVLKKGLDFELHPLGESELKLPLGLNGLQVLDQ